MATSVFRTGRGGTSQARFEREAMLEATLARLTRLDIGDRSLVFGRIDPAGTGERFYIGRVGLWDADHDPILVDWRAPVAEPFYRATGLLPLGLERRRHFASRGSTLLGIEDELFGEKAAIGLDLADRDFDGAAGPSGGGRSDRHPASDTLIASLEAARTGRLNDIVSTIQSEQDRVIRSDMPGVLVVQGGPGTGKTVVALHRAAYLLYTHRFPLESQGVLVVGPNRLFLAYIEQVLPSLGEAGVEQALLADLLSPAVRVAGLDSEAVGRVKGDPRMAGVLRRAARDRRRPLRVDLSVGYELQRLHLTVGQSAEIVAEASRRVRKHNAGRRLVEDAFFAALAGSARRAVDPVEVRGSLFDTVEVREALEWMWPVLTPAHLVNDLYGSKALLRSAAGGRLSDEEIDLLHRSRAAHASEVSWSFQDVPVLDEARALLGYRPGHREEDAVLTYGHIVVDEAQDLSPMELRMIARRSLNGSMTVVGDIAQATGSWAHDGWESVLEGLPDRRPARRAELTLGYRIPAPAMALANRVLPHAAPGALPPETVRTLGDEPRLVACGAAAAAARGGAGADGHDLAALGETRSSTASREPSSHDLAALGETRSSTASREPSSHDLAALGETRSSTASREPSSHDLAALGETRSSTASREPSSHDLAALGETRSSTASREPSSHDLAALGETRSSTASREPSSHDLAALGETRSSTASREPSSHDLAALGETLAEVVVRERSEVGEGNVAVIVPDSLHGTLRADLESRSVVFGGPGRTGLEQQVTLVPVRLVKGLEVDAAVVVEPARIVAEERQGVRSLYVALTRATQRVTVVHAEPLPEVLAEPCTAA